MHLPDDWSEAADRIVSRRAAGQPLAMVVGVPDVGKSTFSAYLATRLAHSGLLTGVIDADVGQSSIGPPAAISGGLLQQPLQALSEVASTASYFVGSISPEGHLLASVVGVQRVATRLRDQGAQALVVDTSGLALGNSGQALKEHKADLLQPSDIVVLQRAGELEHLANLWQRAGGATVHHLRPSAHASQRRPEQRRAYRAQRFAAYFKDAAPISAAFDRLALRGAWLLQGAPLPAPELAQLGKALHTRVLHAERLGRQALLVTAQRPEPQAAQAARSLLQVEEIVLRSPRRFDHLLCGLLNSSGDLLQLAILHHVDFEAGALRLLAPVPRPQGARILHVGRVLLQPDGVELGVLRAADL